MKIMRFFRKPNAPKEWSDPNFVLNIRLRKDGRTLDRRDKATRLWIEQNTRTGFDNLMQSIANKLGCPHDQTHMMGSMHWSHYLNPIKHIRYRITGIWYL